MLCHSFPMRILGITAFVHDASAALVDDGAIVAAADEERFTREKFTGAFPRSAVRFCLEQGGIELADIDYLAFYWNPFRGIPQRAWMMARSLPHSLAFFEARKRNGTAVRGDFVSWWNMVNVARLTRRAFASGHTRFRRQFVAHHTAHAASAFYCSPWDEALVLSLDGTGEWTTTLLGHGRGPRIATLSEQAYPHSLGVLYGAITQFLGYRIYQDEWKVMGLAALGTPSYAAKVRRLIHWRAGAFRLDLDYFNFQYADKGAWFGPRFTELFGPPRQPQEPIETDRFADLAASFQLVTEEIGLALVRHLLGAGGGCRKLCLAGGVALNAVLNGKILAQTDVEEIFVQPAAADSGAALGAALHLHHAVLGGRRSAALRNVYLGPAYEDSAILAALRAAGIPAEKPPQIALQTAALLAAGKVVGWFQGRMEYGPRALGNRSILADPRQARMKDLINAKVKFREAFRPFAPSILAERASEYFVVDGHRAAAFPFMTAVLPVRPEKRAVIPAVTHFDGTGRLQTVEQEVNPRFHALIAEFDRLTGVPVILNTSFNLAGEPIVCTPADAVSTFQRSGLDALAIGDYLCFAPPPPPGPAVS
jgi:carbamoyltransferase